MTALRRPGPQPHAASEGFILVAVLWILAALSTFVAVYSVYVSNTALAAAARSDSLIARSLVSAAVELAAYRLVSVPKEQRPTRGEVAFRMGKANIVAAFRNEAARIDLNAAPKELLAGLFTTLGAKPEAADEYAARIAAWRAPASAAAPDGQAAPDGREASLYRDAGLDYGPRGAPFVHVEELRLVAGLPPELVEQALPYLTVFNGRAEVHALDADPVVLAALPRSPPQQPGTTAPDAGSPDAGSPDAGASDAGPQRALPGTTTEGGDAVRITVRIDFDNGWAEAGEAVILVRDFGDDPYRVLSWREDMGVGTGIGVSGPRLRAEPRR